MDTLHSVIQSIGGESKAKPAHLSVFREFLAHLEQINRQAPKPMPRLSKPARRKPKRGK